MSENTKETKLEKTKKQVKDAWMISGTILGAFLFVCWLYWAIWQDNFWQYIAIGVAVLLLGAVIITPIILAISFTIDYFKLKRSEEVGNNGTDEGEE